MTRLRDGGLFEAECKAARPDLGLQPVSRRLPLPAPLSGAALVREGSFDRQAPPSYLKETLTFVR